MAKPIIDELLAAYNDLRRYLARCLRNPDDAADVAQSSFERVYTRGLTATIAASRALLFRTAQRICIDVVRRWEETEGLLLRDASALSAEHISPPIAN